MSSLEFGVFLFNYCFCFCVFSTIKLKELIVRRSDFHCICTTQHPCATTPPHAAPQRRRPLPLHSASHCHPKRLATPCPFQQVHAAAASTLVPCTGATASVPCGPMSSDPYWSNACKYARRKPLQTVQDAIIASCSVTVGWVCTGSLLLSNLLRCMLPALLCDVTL